MVGNEIIQIWKTLVDAVLLGCCLSRSLTKAGNLCWPISLLTINKGRQLKVVASSNYINRDRLFYTPAFVNGLTEMVMAGASTND